MKYAICYVSTAAENLSDSQVGQILEQSQNDNNSNQITGLLLYSEGNFFQVLEGKKEELVQLFNTIKADSRHFNIIKIFEKEINSNKFNEYEVDFLSLDSRFEKNNLQVYLNQIETLDPSVQSSVKYILKQFAEGI